MVFPLCHAKPYGNATAVMHMEGYQQHISVNPHLVPLVPDPPVPRPRHAVRQIAAAALELLADELVIRLRVTTPALRDVNDMSARRVS